MNETVAIFIAGILVSLNAWVLLEIVKVKLSITRYEERLQSYTQQLGRIVSDIESEKRNRRDVHADFEKRLRTLEHRVFPID